jgi:hypothetical protein
MHKCVRVELEEPSFLTATIYSPSTVNLVGGFGIVQQNGLRSPPHSSPISIHSATIEAINAKMIPHGIGNYREIVFGVPQLFEIYRVTFSPENIDRVVAVVVAIPVFADDTNSTFKPSDHVYPVAILFACIYQYVEHGSLKEKFDQGGVFFALKEEENVIWVVPNRLGPLRETHTPDADCLCPFNEILPRAGR